MTLGERDDSIGADDDQARRVMRVEKLMDKHIRRFPTNDAVARLIACRETMDPKELFESAHASKGLCANLGMVAISEKASAVAEQFRVGNTRTMSDDEVKALLDEIEVLYDRAVAGINAYAQG